MTNKGSWRTDDEKLISMFNNGCTALDIAIELNRTKEATQKRIQYLKKKKIIFERDRKLKQIELREINKAIDYESNKLMSDSSVIKSSLSVYKNNSKGDLVLDREKAKINGYEYTYDMPSKLRNNEGREYNKTFIYRKTS
ncbi:MAG: Helix-turn-helix type 11 domain-containing protein [uncultured Clostridium sp.]